MYVKHTELCATVSIKVTALRKCRLASPKGSIGTTGFHPAPWQVAHIRHGETPEQAFCRVNPRWRIVSGARL